MWIYLSHTLEKNSPTYGDRGGVALQNTSCMSEGGTSNSMAWQLPNHVGTHIDAPRHFSETGETIEKFSAAFWHCREIVVARCPASPDQTVTVKDLQAALKSVDPSRQRICEALLIRTGFEQYRGARPYWESNPGIAPEVGLWLRETWPGLRWIGLDTISLSGWKNRELGRVAHRAFLDVGKGSPVLIVEDMSLAALTPGTELEELVVLPLRVEGADGSPCTVIGKIRD